MKKIIISVASLLLFAGNINATDISYSKDYINRINTFRVGSTTMQGQAIRLSKAKLQALKGKTIDYAEFAVGSRNTTNNTLNVFVTTSLDAEPIAQGTLTINKALERCRWTLDTPYTITGEEENLYIGYTTDIKTTYKLLMGDGSYDIEGYNFAYKDGNWVDTYGLNKGNALIWAHTTDDFDYTDAIIAKSYLDGYFKAGDKCDLTARFVNAGTTTINSFDAIIKIGDKTTTQHYADVDIKAKDNYSFNITGVNSDSEGEQNVSVAIANVNGGNDETDCSDNSTASTIYFYPHDMERTLLAESFTGQDCTQCPSGHLVIKNVLENSDEDIVEVSHHVGFYPDMFTMAEDDACRFFYSNPSSTSAPAIMVNRNANTDISSFPVIGIDYNNIVSLISHAAASKPYASLNLESQLDENTRELKVKLQILPHTTLPSDKMLFNVYLVQDGLAGYQSNGGTDYIHNRVVRGTLTGNAWGIIVPNLTPGKVATWEETVTIPEKIHSSYWTDDLLSDGMYGGKYTADQVNIDAVLKNMTLVAYFGEYDADDNAKNIVYNCCEVKLGESHKQKGFSVPTDINATKQEADNVGIAVNGGKVNVAGDYDKMAIYDITGKQIDANSRLEKGVYIVKVIANGKQTTKKVLIK